MFVAFFRHLRDVSAASEAPSRVFVRMCRFFVNDFQPLPLLTVACPTPLLILDTTPDFGLPGDTSVMDGPNFCPSPGMGRLTANDGSSGFITPKTGSSSSQGTGTASTSNESHNNSASSLVSGETRYLQHIITLPNISDLLVLFPRNLYRERLQYDIWGIAWLHNKADITQSV